MKLRRGFTVIEVLVVISIIAIVTAIAFPVIAKARRGAHVTDSVNRLRQGYIAVALYRHAEGTDWAYGDIGEMGIPPVSEVVKRGVLGVPLETFHSACGAHPSQGILSPSFRWWSGNGDPEWTELVNLYRERTPLFTDDNCNDADIDLNNPYLRKLGLGVTVEGQMLRRYRLGDIGRAPFWVD